MSLSPIFHQVCSSDLVSEHWLLLLSYFDTNLWNGPLSTWTGLGTKHFRLLSTLCQLANTSIDDAIRRFNMQSFITLNVLIESDFNDQMNTILNQFIESLIIQFNRLIDTVYLYTQVDQPYTTFDNANLFLINTRNEINGQQSLQLKFNLSGMININGDSVACICAIDPDCQSPSALIDYYEPKNGNFIPFPVPGMMTGCFTIDSLLLSTLECYYSDSCLSIQYKYINKTMSTFDTGVEFFYIKTLIYNSSLSRFPPNTSLSTIVKQLMVEQWNPSYSFDRYYNACAPIYCTYSYTIHSYSFIRIIINLVSTIGGLILALRIITPQIVNIVFSLVKPKVKTQQKDDQKLFDRMKKMFINLIILLYTTLINLNIFPIHTFGSNISRSKAKHLGQLSTRVFIIFLIIGFSILGLYTIIQPEMLTNTFNKPSLDTYYHLINNYNNTLQCPCSSISSTYDRFIKINPVFHQICSSPFISKQWRINVTSGLVPNLSVYNIRDYRRFISSHLQFLSGLCNISIQTTNDLIIQFLSSSFITNHLLSPSVFNIQIDSIIKQSKSNAPITFTRLLYILQSINHGNKIISSYGTNFEYIVYPYTSNDFSVFTRPIIYDNECSCALNSNCTTQAVFMKINSSEIIPIKGLKMGCRPTESFLQSTLECFYDQSCIYLIQQQINNISITNIPLSLFNNMTRFLMNTTIIDLVNELFIENWSTMINYSSYFYQCSPSSCSYKYIPRFNYLYTITTLLGLYGGLTFVFRWISPNIVYFIDKIYYYRKKKSNIVIPISSIQLSIIHNDNIKFDLNNQNLISTVSTQSRNIFSRLLWCLIFSIIIFIFMIISIIITSVYLNQQYKNYSLPLTSSTMTTIDLTVDKTITTTTGSISSGLTGQLTFESIVSYSTGYDSGPSSIVVADFNNDSHLDIAVTNYGMGNIGILLGNNDGTFEEQITYSTGSDSQPGSLTLGDFNRDDKIDLAVANCGTDNVGLLLGNNDGTFHAQRTFSLQSGSCPNSIGVGDFNRDNQLDIALVTYYNYKIILLIGNSTLNFERRTTYHNDACRIPLSIGVGDFNRDGQLDVAVTNMQGSVCVLLGSGDGHFSVLTTFSLEHFSEPNAIAVNDFNSDYILDLAIVNSERNNVGIMIGNGDGTFQSQIIYSTGYYSRPTSVAVGDLNNDGKLDLALTNNYAHSISVFIGFDNGTFLPAITYEAGARSIPTSISLGDFNNDGELDIVITDNTLNNVGILLNTCHCCIS